MVGWIEEERELKGSVRMQKDWIRRWDGMRKFHCQGHLLFLQSVVERCTLEKVSSVEPTLTSLKPSRTMMNLAALGEPGDIINYWLINQGHY